MMAEYYALEFAVVIFLLLLVLLCLGTDAPNIQIGLEQFDIDFAHGGLWFGFVTPPYKVAHVYSSFKLGWGEANLKDNDGFITQYPLYHV